MGYKSQSACREDEIEIMTSHLSTQNSISSLTPVAVNGVQMDLYLSQGAERRDYEDLVPVTNRIYWMLKSVHYV